MKKFPICAIAFFAMMLALSCNNGSENESTGAYNGPPYTIKVEEYVNPKLPALHSYTHAVYKDMIIMFGGRVNGLHVSYNFGRGNANKTIYVIDTKNWSDPAGWTVSSMPASRIMLPNINTAQFIANNAEFFTDDSTLYVMGGLVGANVPTKLRDAANPRSGVVLVTTAKSDDGKPPTGPITLPYLTAVNLPALVDMVVNNKAMPLNSIRQVMDTSLGVTGGEVSMTDKNVQLVFGWNFSTPPGPFGPGDRYTHQIRSFSYKDDGKTLTMTPVTVCKTCWDGESDTSTNGNFRRRDGSMSAMIDPADGSPFLLYYSGVFKGGGTNFDSPVWIGKGTAAEQGFVMRSNVYTCQVVPVYCKSKNAAYATLLGGMKNANYTGAAITKPILLTDKNDTIIAADNTFNHVPFTNQFSTVVVDAKHVFSQYLLPDSFPNTKTPITLPASAADSIGPAILPPGSVAYNGAESELIWILNSGLMPHGVIDYDAFIKANPAGAVIGYLHGGILSALTNAFGAPAGHYTVASNRIFAVRLVPVGK